MNSVQIHGELLLLRERLKNRSWPRSESIKAVTLACGDIDYLLLFLDIEGVNALAKEEASATINSVYQQLDNLHQNYDLIYTQTEGPLSEIINLLLSAIEKLVDGYTNEN